MSPSSDEQIQFLINLQRLLDEGQFTASYKFALLMALADLSIEHGDDSGAPLQLSTDAIAEKFIQYYWRQVVPYPSPVQMQVLQQNTAKQAAIVNAVREARAARGDSLARMIRSGSAWRSLVKRVGKVVREMPLNYLQNVGGKRLDFLYGDVGPIIELRPGVAACFRKFHALIADLVRGAWLRYVRQQNFDVLGETADLNEFLFGSERVSLVDVRPVLTDLQHGQCFYCRRPLTPANTHVDHFVPWARYPVDLGHNFVLADDRCNNKKRDRLPACEHLGQWTERNTRFGDQIRSALEEGGMISELAASNRVAHWAYSQTEAVHGLTWVRADELVPFAAEWRHLLA